MITRTYEMDHNRNFWCVVTYDGQSGSILYRFRSGDIEANKPANLPDTVWINLVKDFLQTCNRMIRPFEDD